MKKPLTTTCLLLSLAALLPAQEPEWSPANVKECNRACLVATIDAYMNAMFERDSKAVPPLAKDVRMTENTAEVGVGEGVLWRSRTEPTAFKIYVADPVSQQVALQARLRVQGRDTLAAIRLKLDRGKILEIEQLQLGNVAPWATVSALTKSRRRSARAAWTRCIVPATPG